MKPGKLLPSIFKKKRGQQGQSIVEFVLLLTVIALISMTFVGFMNRNLARYWEYSVNLIINDKPGGPKNVTLD